MCPVGKNTQLADLLHGASLLIWDEVPIQHQYCFKAVNRMFRDVCDDNALFGGLSTGFAQILPVVCREGRPVTVNACL